MSDDRTQTARDTDDGDLIDTIDEAPDAATTAGGNLARDVGSQDELAQIGDPEAHTRATKEDDIDNDAASRSSRTPDG